MPRNPLLRVLAVSFLLLSLVSCAEQIDYAAEQTGNMISFVADKIDELMGQGQKKIEKQVQAVQEKTAQSLEQGKNTVLKPLSNAQQNTEAMGEKAKERLEQAKAVEE